MSTRKYATAEDVEGVKKEVEVLHVKVDQVRQIFDLNGDLSADAATKAAALFWGRLVTIAKHDEQTQTQRQAWQMVRADMSRRLHLKWIHERIGEKFIAALLGGLGFTLAGKLADVFGLLSAVEQAVHIAAH